MLLVGKLLPNIGQYIYLIVYVFIVGILPCSSLLYFSVIVGLLQSEILLIFANF